MGGYCLVTYGKLSARVISVSGRMTLPIARRMAKNTRYLVDIVARY